MINSSQLHKFQEYFFDIFVSITYFLILISSLGLSNSAPKYLANIDYYIRIYICLFLLWRFNPFRRIKTFTELDRKIVFSAGLFIITTTALNKYLIMLKL
jgi:hypothetical protein